MTSGRADTEDLWNKWHKTKSQSLREELLNVYVPLVKQIYSRLRIGLPDEAARQLGEDLVNAGVIGLVQAFDRFSRFEKVKFETFASHRIRGAMLDELRKHDWLKKNSRRRLKEIQRAWAEVEQNLQRAAFEEDVAAHMGIKVDVLREELIEIGPATLSFLEGLAPQQEDGSWGDFIKDPTAVIPELEVQKNELLEKLAQEITNLPDRERMVLVLYVQEELGQKEIAEVLGVTPSRVSQIYSQAVLRLQSKLLPVFN